MAGAYMLKTLHDTCLKSRHAPGVADLIGHVQEAGELWGWRPAPGLCSSSVLPWFPDWLQSWTWILLSEVLSLIVVTLDILNNHMALQPFIRLSPVLWPGSVLQQGAPQPNDVSHGTHVLISVGSCLPFQFPWRSSCSHINELVSPKSGGDFSGKNSLFSNISTEYWAKSKLAACRQKSPQSVLSDPP